MCSCWEVSTSTGDLVAGQEYALGYRREEQERLQRQAEELAAEALRLFDQIGVSAGQRVLEIGCGPRGCLALLAHRVGPSGSVVGIEINGDLVALAEQFVHQSGISNVTVLCGDARSSGLQPDSFDTVAARLVLVNVPEPEEIVSQAVALARPGGVVAFHEVDWAAMICEPSCAEWTSLIEAILAVTAQNGTSFFVGRRLPNMLKRAGLEHIGVNPILHYHPVGDPRRSLMLTFADNFKDRIITQGLMPAEEFDALRGSLARRLDDPDTAVYIGPYIQAWGRKPSS